MANKILKKWIGEDQVDSSKILLENDSALRSKDSGGSTQPLLKIDSTDKVIAYKTGGAEEIAYKSDVNQGGQALQDHLNDAEDAHDASAISVSPSGNLGSTDVQAALSELQGDIDQEKTDRETADLDFVKLDGTRPMTGSLDMGSQEILNVANMQAQKVQVGPMTFDGGQIFPLIPAYVDLNGAKITNMNPGTGPGDAVEFDQLSVEIGERQTADAGLQTQIDGITNSVGAPGGIAPLNESSKVPASYLPSYVDDVLEFANLAAFPATGESDKIYIAIDTSKTYRWSGSMYVEVSPSEVNSVNGQTGIVVLDTDDVSEGSSNLYYTESRWDARLATKTSDNVSEGTTNLYYTAARKSAIEAYADQAEADAKSYADGIVSTEAGARETADNALDSRLDTLEARAFYKHKRTLDATDISNGYINLPHVVIDVVAAFADRLAIHEGATEDFTLSTVGGVTRMTFVNELVEPGSQKLQAGDNIYVKYFK